MLVVSEIAREYATRGEPLVVLRDISFQLSAGDSLAILGPSGSGKSTLLHILGTLDRPTSGRVTLNGVNPFDLSGAAQADWRNEHVGFVFQDHHLLPHLTALENLLIPALAHGKASPTMVSRAQALLRRVGLADRRDHRPPELSGGERQRVAVARALLMRPNLVLADEPTGNLDQANSTSITDLLMQLKQDDEGEPPILIVVTHSHEVAARLSRRLTLENGRLAEVVS